MVMINHVDVALDARSPSSLGSGVACPHLRASRARHGDTPTPLGVWFFQWAFRLLTGVCMHFPPVRAGGSRVLNGALVGLGSILTSIVLERLLGIPLSFLIALNLFVWLWYIARQESVQRRIGAIVGWPDELPIYLRMNGYATQEREISHSVYVLNRSESKRINLRFTLRVLLDGSEKRRIERAEPVVSPDFRFNLGPGDESEGKFRWSLKGRIDPKGNHTIWLVVRDLFSKRTIKVPLGDMYPPDERPTWNLGKWSPPPMGRTGSRFDRIRWRYVVDGAGIVLACGIVVAGWWAKSTSVQTSVPTGGQMTDAVAGRINPAPLAPVESPARIRVTRTQPVPMAVSKAPFPAMNIYFDNDGDLPAVGYTYRWSAAFSSAYLPGTEIAKAQDDLLAWDGWRAQVAANALSDLYRGDGKQLSIPNQENQAAEFIKRFDGVFSGTDVLYLFVTFKYTDQSLPPGGLRVTEFCGWYQGNPLRHECGRNRTFVESPQ